MYRTSGISARANTTARINGRPRQLLSGQQGLGLASTLRASFRDRLPDSSGADNDEILTDDSDDEVIVTGSRPVLPPPILIDANSFAPVGLLILSPGSDVELQDQTFIRIVENLPESQRVRGYRLVRQNHPELFMPERHHELVQLVKVDMDLNVEHTFSEVHVTFITRNCKIAFTNQQYKYLNYRKDIHVCGEDVEKPIFFCRWTSADTNVGTEDGDPDGPPLAGRIEHLRQHQADPGALVTKNGQQVEFQISDPEVRKQWRGDAHCTLRGSHIKNQYGIQKRQYTFGDAFAGAGGTSSGALAANLKMKFAFDLDKTASETYTDNFGATGMQILQTDVYDFVRTATASPNEFIVDILHMSPPCQPFCGANRTPNEEDNRRNLAAFARVADLLEICKPRIATLEESKSLTDSDKRRHFHMLISFFVKKGYSVQWKALNLSTFGVPQTRKRTIIIASGPGEKLPAFLKPTHGNGPGLKALPSIRTALDSIPRDARHRNDIFRMQTMKTPYSPDILCHTILTAVKSHHYIPDGTRRFSIREYAALQTFPHHFNFRGGKAACLKQIGNAVPPMVGEELFRHITAQLRASDEAEERVAGHPRPGSFQGHARFFDIAAAGQANNWQF